MAAPVEDESQILRGTAAAPGRAVGPVHLARMAAPVVVQPRDAEAALRAALAVAVDELRALAGGADMAAAGILEFQIEMLLDEEILTPALVRIRRGEGVALAWAGAMGAYIDGFTQKEGDDDAFAARIADLADMRQRVLNALAGRTSPDFPAGAIYVGNDMAPSTFLAHDWSAGGAIALRAGSAIGHVAVLARARAVPMVVDLGPLDPAPGDRLLVDGDTGLVRLNPVQATSLHPAKPHASSFQAAFPAGVSLSVTINTLDDLCRFDPQMVEGVGLVRTEFLFASAAEALSEAQHEEVYRQILEKLDGRPVTVRMLDLGGDKTLAGIGAGSTSPLGQRGIRLLLAYPELARVQIRALLRAAAFGPLRVLLPMVTLPEEVTAMARLFAQEEERLAGQGLAMRRPPVGIMVEVPATALTLDMFDEAAFFSVGTNDLLQYLSAASRDNPAVAPLAAGSQTALFRLLEQVSASAGQLGKPVSICGDLAGDPEGLARLVAAGFRDVSVAPGRLAALRVNG